MYKSVRSGNYIMERKALNKPCNKNLFKRYKYNPIVTTANLQKANSIYNSAVILFNNGYVGVFRVRDTSMVDGLHVGWSSDGIKWQIEQERIRMECEDPDVECNGRGYDPRITLIENTYYITWCASYHGPTIGIAETKDFKKFHRLPNPLPPYNRNGVLFPKKIDGKFAMLHRPCDTGHTAFGDIFFSSSSDLIHWGEHRWVFGPAGGWQSTKVGAGPPPIETEDGWLLIYHGVVTTCNGYIYCAGGAILDKEKPWKVLYRTKNYLLSPEEDYERIGDVSNVVFPTGSIVDKKTGQLALYYGCADTSFSVAYAQLDDVLSFIKNNSSNNRKR